MLAQVTYNIAEELLSGSLDGAAFRYRAGSGGRAGSKTPDAVNWYLQNNPLATNVHSGGHMYGPLPLGLYWMRPHERDSHMVRLDPFPSNHMMGRSGFLIHGRGKIGSHGCIVPYNFQDVLHVCSAVKRYVSTHREKPVLSVVAIGMDLDRKFNTA